MSFAGVRRDRSILCGSIFINQKKFICSETQVKSRALSNNKDKPMFKRLKKKKKPAVQTQTQRQDVQTDSNYSDALIGIASIAIDRISDDSTRRTSSDDSSYSSSSSDSGSSFDSGSYD